MSMADHVLLLQALRCVPLVGTLMRMLTPHESCGLHGEDIRGNFCCCCLSCCWLMTLQCSWDQALVIGLRPSRSVAIQAGRCSRDLGWLHAYLQQP